MLTLEYLTTPHLTSVARRSLQRQLGYQFLGCPIEAIIGGTVQVLPNWQYPTFRTSVLYIVYQTLPQTSSHHKPEMDYVENRMAQEAAKPTPSPEV
jgi:hypothetical protein